MCVYISEEIPRILFTINCVNIPHYWIWSYSHNKLQKIMLHSYLSTLMDSHTHTLKLTLWLWHMHRHTTVSELRHLHQSDLHSHSHLHTHTFTITHFFIIFTLEWRHIICNNKHRQDIFSSYVCVFIYLCVVGTKCQNNFYIMRKFTWSSCEKPFFKQN